MTSPPQAVRREIAARGLAKALPAWMRSLGGETGGRITTRGACRSKKICTCWYATKTDRFSFWYWLVSPVFAGTGPRVPLVL